MFDTLLYLVHEIMYLDLIILDIVYILHHNLYESQVGLRDNLSQFVAEKTFVVIIDIGENM